MNNDGNVIVIIGRRETGKSVLVRDVLFSHQDIPFGTILSGKDCYSDIVPKSFMHNEYTSSSIHKILNRQKTILKENLDDTKVDPRHVVIFDGCFHDARWTSDAFIHELIMHAIDYKILLVITLTYPLGIQPHLRNSINYIFILQENVTNNRRRIYENYASLFPSFHDFCIALDGCTNEYDCLVIDNTSKSTKIEDRIFYYNVKQHSDFQLGAKEFWN